MNLTIKHVSTIDPGCFGVFLDDGVPFAVTLERTYLEGGAQVTKIPDGIHHCTRTLYLAGGYVTFEIHVEGHSRILFHKANVETQLDGCVAVGEEFGVLDGMPAILHCGNGGGFDKFFAKVQGLQEFDVTVE
jgi:hypothetical protein